ncbi:ABC transporter ATP-binding protein [Saccharicrinis fermentans]|uniref:Macrolide export ATP-binding/permease protein MacB n=1 Tax=Saccharicrinis fermentans DSM 9555 = JCM 21142 TaxID=869213 RepID=W7Y660_9BACT|nr:ABC transporter ATP-binding protein [Saccharicrinis fermentans]GAF03652.1 macrolide export ATP-binding/permease protein MacB [Saccharicrinis fermentans DSM 9555 = JCM 21142]
MSDNKIIEIKDLHKNYQVGDETVKALRGVDLLITKGEFVAIMGTSGSGKSTLLNILGCLDKASQGDYWLDGINVKTLKRNQLAEIRSTKLGFVFQSYNLLPRTTALENVELPLLYNPQINSKLRREKAEAALEAVGLKDRMKHLSNQMSGGQQQRVAIARSIVNDPVIILADEATGNLDTRTSFEIMALFQELNQKGITIGFVTHEPDIAAFTKRNILFRDGRLIKDFRTENPLSAQKAIEALKNDDYILNQV